MKPFCLFMLLVFFSAQPGYAQKSLQSLRAMLKPSAAVKSVQSAGRLLAGSVSGPAAGVARTRPAAAPLLSQTPAGISAQSARRLSQAITRQAAAVLPNYDMRIFQPFVEEAPSIRFSGTVFSVTYNGKKEIYGAIATHIIPDVPTNPTFGIKRQFEVNFYQNGLPRIVPAEVVAASPVSVLDIALVKFPAEIEPLLKPYEIGEVLPGKPLHSVGFNTLGIRPIEKRRILQQTPASIRTDILVPRKERPGLCGSAVLNAKGELVGIHTGSISQPYGEGDQAFVTPSRYLKALVNSYHNNGIAPVDFYINSEHSLPLNADEHIHSVVLLDAHENILWKHDVIDRFSHSSLEKALKQYPQARFVDITAQRIQWTPDGDFLQRHPHKRISPLRAYVYDLQTKKVISSEELK